jgi:hypothetical protein
VAQTFFVLKLTQRQAERTVWTHPVIDSQSPPAERGFGIVTARKSKRTAHLMGIHPTSRAVARLNRGGIGDSVAELFQDLLDTPHGAVCVANIDFDHALTLAVLDDLDMGQRARDTVAHVRKAPTLSFSAGAVGDSGNKLV